jgi:hypothetical protein
MSDIFTDVAALMVPRLNGMEVTENTSRVSDLFLLGSPLNPQGVRFLYEHVFQCGSLKVTQFHAILLIINMLMTAPGNGTEIANQVAEDVCYEQDCRKRIALIVFGSRDFGWGVCCAGND